MGEWCRSKHIFYIQTIYNIREIGHFYGFNHKFDSKNYCQTCAFISLFQKCEKRVNGRMLLVHGCTFTLWQFGTYKKLPTFPALSHFGRPFMCKNSTCTSLLDFSISHFPIRVFQTDNVLKTICTVNVSNRVTEVTLHTLGNSSCLLFWHASFCCYKILLHS